MIIMLSVYFYQQRYVIFITYYRDNYNDKNNMNCKYPLTTSISSLYLYLIWGDNMATYKVKDIHSKFVDDESCLEWLKTQRYPNGIKCCICKRVTKHHKVSKKPCYACDNCGHHVYPAAGTIFHKSTTPLKTWFDVMRKISDSKWHLSARDIQREYGMTYKTAWRMLRILRKHFAENQSGWDIVGKTGASTAGGVKPGVTGTRLKKKDVIALNNNNGVAVVPEIGPFFMIDSSQYGIKREHQRKRDRIARLLKLQMLLCQNSQGLQVTKIASECSTSKRTVYRDLEALESEIGVPIWEDNGKRGIPNGYFLPPIHFTPKEAFIIFLAVRLMRNFIPECGSVVTSTFFKLNTVVPPFLQKQILDTLKHFENKPGNENVIRNFNTLFDAWISQHKAKILYQDIDNDKPTEHIIEPYYIEPSIIEPSMCWVIAFCHIRKTIRTFPIKHIVGKVIIEQETYEIPADFNPVDYLDSVWGVPIDNDIEVVKLRFKPETSRFILSSPFLSSRLNKILDDGSVVITIKVGDTLRFCNWILGWKDGVEVLEPEALRRKITEFAQSIVDIYACRTPEKTS
jgi:predicted DNA-binding transcriptional regulator YafY